MGAVNLGTALLVALAPLAGFIIGRMAKEELKPGQKWFLLAKRALFVTVIAVFLYAHKWMLWHVVIGLTALFAYLVLKPFRIWWLVQAVLGLAFALNARTSLHFLTSALIFLYGLPTGAVLARKKAVWKPIAAGGVFFLVAVAASTFL